MSKPCVLSYGLWLSLIAFSPSMFAQESSYPDFLLAMLDEVDVEGMEPDKHIGNLLGIAAQLYNLEHHELAHVLLADATDVADEFNDPRHYSVIAEHLIATRQFDAAKKLMGKTGNSRKWLPQRLVTARIRAGDLSAYDKKDYAVTGFHTVLDVADALIENGEMEKAVDLVSNLVFKPNDGNDPKDAQGIVYQKIAMKFHQRGDGEQARKYIDLAVEAAGNQFYTGFALQVDRRVIYGELTKDMMKFAKRGAAYRGHMGDELVANYARALYDSGKYDEAHRVIELVESKENREYSRMTLAIAQARKGEIELATKSIDQLKNPASRFQALVHLALKFSEPTQGPNAEKNEHLAKYTLAMLFELLEENQVSDQSSINRLAYLLGRRQNRGQLRGLFNRQKDDQGKAGVVTYAFMGLAKAEMY